MRKKETSGRRSTAMKLCAAACFLALGLTGCGHEHTWVEATCLAPKTCSKCGETEGEVLSHAWVEATYTEPKTCSLCGLTEGEPLPEPYYSKNHITFGKLEDMELPFYVGFVKDNELVEIDGMRIETEPVRYTFGEVTCKLSKQEGYVDVTIPYEANGSFKVYQDTSKYKGTWETTFLFTGFGVGDCYTGLGVSDRNTQGDEMTQYQDEFTWDGKSYAVSYTMDVQWSPDSWSDWVKESGKVYYTTWSGTNKVVYTITVPKDYDGAVLYTERGGTTKEDVEKELEKQKEGTEKDIEDKEEYLLEDGKTAEDGIFYRLSDFIP